MLESGPWGFRNAPVSKCLTIFTPGFSLFVSLMNIKDKLNLAGGLSSLSSTTTWIGGSQVQITRFPQLWRIITNHFFFTSPGEILLGLIFLYYFRLFERQMGTQKFAVFSFLSFCISALLQVLLLVVFPHLKIVSGPYGFLFACFVQYYFTIPVTVRFRLFRFFYFTDKMIVYFLGFQLLLANGSSSLVAGGCGIVAGLMFATDILRLKHLKFPSAVNSFSERFILPLISSPPSSASTSYTPRRFSTAAPLQYHTTTSTRSTRSALPHQFVAPTPSDGYPSLYPSTTVSQQIAAIPNAEYVDLLTQMGFSRVAAFHALQQSNNDLQFATNILLEQSSST